jgi:thymidine kinase
MEKFGKCGRIDLIIGSMFSGKSTELIRRINRYRVLDKNILVVKHKLDKRYSENSISTHSNINLDCISLDKLEEINTTADYKQDYNNCDVLVVEEAQFFEDLYSFVTHSADVNNKIVIVAGLDGDSNRKKFGEILDLVPECETITKLHALCVKCNDGTPASFSKILIKNDSQIYIGVSQYIAVCRYHFHNE